MQQKTDLQFISQDDSKASHAPKIFREDCRIKWTEDIKKIYNLIRGLSPYPAAFCEIKNGDDCAMNLKIFKSRMIPELHTNNNGLLIAESEKLFVYCQGGKLELTDLQLEGKKRMSSAEFLRGFKIKENAHLV